MFKNTFLATCVLLISASAASAKVNPESDSYKTGSTIGYVILGGMVLLVVVDLLRRKGILDPKKKSSPNSEPWKMTPRLLTFTILLLLLVAYIGSYLPRRSDGSYKITKTGEIRTDKGIPLVDVQLWNPVGCWWQHTFKEADGSYASKGNKMGYFYAPLITWDRRFNYPDLRIDRPSYIPNPSGKTAQR